jgi:glycosyltransferase involved in cell wall biosynthesis
MRRVLIFATEFPPGPGGIGVHAYQVARNLSQSQWEVAVLAKQDYASAEEIRLFNQGQAFSIEQWPRASHFTRQTIGRWQALTEKLKTYRPHIVLASGESAVWLTAMLTQMPTFRKTHWVAVWHGMTPTQPFLRALSRWSYHQPTAVIAVSHYGLEQLIHMGVQPQSSQVIHNGADPEIFFPIQDGAVAEFRKQHAPAEAQVLLTVGHVSERKGQEIVIRALPRIIQEHPTVHYWMVGLPTQQNQLEMLAKQIGVLDHIHFLGKLSQEDLRTAYNACDLFIMTSRHSQDGQFEGYGIAAVEAALCGKAAVVSDRSGLVEAILPDETGLVVRENDPQSTAQAVMHLLNHPELCTQMGVKARHRAQTEQTWTSRVNQYDLLLRQIVRNPKSPGDTSS